MSPKLGSSFIEKTKLALSEFNWNTSQPAKLESVKEYVDLAQKLKPQLAQFLDALKDATGVDLQCSNACTKTEESATRKLSDDTILWEPSAINDYLRGTANIKQVGAKGNEDTFKVIDYLLTSKHVVGFKNQIMFPDESSGMRCFKAHIKIENPENPEEQMTAELIIGHVGMQDAYKRTISLRNFERDLERLVATAPNVFGDQNKTVSKGLVAIKAVHELRHAIHNEAAEKIGWNSLIDPSVKDLHQTRISSIPTDTLYGALGKRQLGHIVQNSLVH